MWKSASLALAALLLGAAAPGSLGAEAPGSLGAEAPGPLGVGRIALPEEIAAWDIDARPDGAGLPPGQGTARQGETLFQERCATCHGEFGEGAGRWPPLAGGAGSLRSERPEKTIGSFWPHATTVFDYVRRAMPFGNAQSLTPDEVYAITAYLLSLNDVIGDEDAVLDARSLAAIRLPNAPNFHDDDRETTERAFWTTPACMRDCLPAAPHVVSRARALDVTPEGRPE